MADDDKDDDRTEDQDPGEQDDPEDQDPDDGGDDDGGDDKDWKPPTREEVRALQAKLKKANGDAAHHRGEATKLRQQSESDAEKQVREAVEKAEGDAEARWKPIVVRQAARAALAQAGLIGKPDRLLKLLDMDEIEVDEDGALTGLDDQVRELRSEYKHLFAKRGSSRIDGAGGDDDAPKSGLSKASQRMLAQARGL